jgi:hypothetical protein
VAGRASDVNTNGKYFNFVSFHKNISSAVGPV